MGFLQFKFCIPFEALFQKRAIIWHLGDWSQPVVCRTNSYNFRSTISCGILSKYCFQHNFVVNLGQRFSCHHVNVLFFFKSVWQTFFRRSFLRSTPYKCDKEGDCLINAEKQNGSRPCPACRLVKCLDLGMSKDGTCLSLNYVQEFLISLKLY